ncbi:MAG: MaoC family dehydratase N-terminal domain-containing protein [Desulfobacterales bacterium]|nr:MaoC family dehydratase N-terminal domain-containing protein [Desulfobacterales bacterium]
MAATEAKMTEGEFTPELIAEMESKKGLKLNLANHLFNEEATRGAIRRFVDGVGDPNPLWRDPDYAKQTRYGTIVAPPSWVFSVLAGVQFGWRGLAGFHSGSDMEFHLPVLRNDLISPEETFADFDGPRPSKFAKRIVIDYFDDRYHRQGGQEVTKSLRWVIRAERQTARKEGKYSAIQLPHPWTEEELKKIGDETLASEIRGSEVRFWEDVIVGQELTPVVKGPLGMTDNIAFIMGGGAPVKLEAHEVALKKYRQHPAWAFLDPSTYALEPIFAVHYNKQAAMAMGLPDAYDVGTQRHCWQIHLLTNWIGDEGWLKKSRAEYRRFVYLSDVVWHTGKVINKHITDDQEYCVDIETHAMNQRGEDTMPGTATVVLPSRSAPEEKWPVSRRLALLK